jgi:hypothetical protein
MPKIFTAVKWVLVALIVAWIVYATIRVQQGVEGFKDAISPAPTDTVYVHTTYVDTVIEKAIEQKVTFVDKIVTKEVEPDTVFIATGEPRPVEELPDYGIQEVVKDGERLEVTALARDGSRAEKRIYSLPDASTDYRLTSGSSPSMLRTSRTWNVVKLEGELTIMVGSAGVVGVAEGPISVTPLPNLSVQPAIMVDSDGASFGVTGRVTF